MAAAISHLYAELDLKNQRFKRGTDEVVRDSGRMQKALGGVMSSAKTAAIGVAAVGAAAVIAGGFLAKGAISAASDLSETISKTTAVFGTNADAVLKWGDTAATAVGQSKQAALEAASTVGNLLKGVGVANKDLPMMSENIIQAAADLGSFNNIDPAQVVEDLRSAMVGEAEPVRKYGILLNEAAVKAKALELGLAGTDGELSEGAKVQARYALIMEQLGDAQGDFAKTSGGLANGTRILKAHLSDLRAQIGMKLLPVVTRIVMWVNRWFKAFEEFRAKGMKPFLAGINALQQGLTKLFGAGIATAITAGLLDIGDLFGKIARAIRDFFKPIGGLIGWFKQFRDDGLNPVSAALKAVGTWLHQVRLKSKPLTRIINDLGRVFSYVGQALHDFLSGNPEKGIKHLGDAWHYLKDAVKTALNQIPWAKIADTIGTKVGDVFRAVNWSAVGTAIMDGLKRALQYVFDHPKSLIAIAAIAATIAYGPIGGIIVAAIALGIVNNWHTINETIVRQMSSVGGDDVVSALKTAILSWPEKIGEQIGSVGTELVIRLAREITQHPAEIAEAIGKLLLLALALGGLILLAPIIIGAATVVGIVKGIWGKRDAIVQAGASLLGWVLSGVLSLIPWFEVQSHAIPNAVLGAIAGFGGWFFNAGRDIVSGIWNGIASLGGWLWNQVSAFIQNSIVNAVKDKLDILSPSKVMIDIGANVTRGMAIGMLKQAGDIEGAAARMTRAATGMGGSGSVGSPSLATRAITPPLATAAGGQATSARTINIHPGAIVVNESSSAEETARVILRKIRFAEAGAA